MEQILWFLFLLLLFCSGQPTYDSIASLITLSPSLSSSHSSSSSSPSFSRRNFTLLGNMTTVATGYEWITVGCQSPSTSQSGFFPPRFIHFLHLLVTPLRDCLFVPDSRDSFSKFHLDTTWIFNSFSYREQFWERDCDSIPNCYCC